MTNDLTDLPQHTHVVIKHPDGINTRIIKTGVLYGRPLTLDEELLLAMLAACADKDTEIAALKDIIKELAALDFGQYPANLARRVRAFSRLKGTDENQY